MRRIIIKDVSCTLSVYVYIYIYIYTYIVVTTKVFSENKVLNIAKIELLQLWLHLLPHVVTLYLTFADDDDDLQTGERRM